MWVSSEQKNRHYLIFYSEQENFPTKSLLFLSASRATPEWGALGTGQILPSSLFHIKYATLYQSI